MRTRTHILAVVLAMTAALSQEASALNYPTPLSLPDKYVGDTAIYYSDASQLLPNVLFVVDTSAAMKQPGRSDAYQPTITYGNPATRLYSPNMVYSRTTATGGTVTYVGYGVLDISLASGTGSISCAVAKNSLKTAGSYPGRLKKDGTCAAPQDGDYYVGNYLNYMFAPADNWHENTAYTVGAVVPDNDADPTRDYTWTCSLAGTSGVVAVNPFPTSMPLDANGDPDYSYIVHDGTAQWKLSSSIITVVRTALQQVMSVPDIRAKMRAGLMVMGGSNHGGLIKQKVDDISTATGNTNYTNLMTAIGNLTPQNLLGSSVQLVNEMLWDADLYFRRPGGAASDANLYDTTGFTGRISQDTNASQSAKSPIQQPCQHNYVVVITQGNQNDPLQRVGDRTGDGNEGFVDDASDLLHETDHYGNDSDGTTSVETIVLQIMSPRDGRLILTAGYGNGITRTIEWATDADGDGFDIDVNLLPQEDVYYYLVSSADQLVQKLLEALLDIGKQSQTSFVAPVVPVSPENRTYSGTRVYMGFFRPMKDKKPWRGNLKKYGMNTNGDILDREGQIATYVDLDSNGIDDRDGAALPTGKRNGDFRPNSVSYWTFEDSNGDLDPSQQCKTNDINSTVGRTLDASGVGPLEGQCFDGRCGDGGIVDCGGVGEKLKNRSITNPRKIYTFLTGDMLPPGYTANPGNYIWTPNAKMNALCTAEICGGSDADYGAITARHLNILSPVKDAAGTLIGYDASPGFYPVGSFEAETFGAGNPPYARSNILKYAHGVDAYDNDDGDGDKAENRFWTLGDVLHSRPQVVGYSTYTIADEKDCTKNKTLIYVGANDGMLHVFRDCNGEEAWAFVPPNLLGNLRQLAGKLHVNFVDSSAQAYVFDNDGDGNIELAESDKVYLVMGQRRGGGQHAWEAKGFYIILDVSDPENPRYIRQLDYGMSPNISELGETWSEPKLAKIKIQDPAGGEVFVIAAFVGGGYDNCNEDSRYGNNQKFIGACALTSTPDAGLTVSGGSNIDMTGPRQKGRGVYVLRLATLQNNAPTLIGQQVFTWPTGTVGPIWKRDRTVDPNMKYSFPGDMALVDTNFDGFVDKVYAGDTGGNLWRFDLDASPVSTVGASILSGAIIFRSNPDSGTDVGRKIFYKPAITLEEGMTMIFFGTGDREHPLNRSVTDRMYAFKDRDGADYSNNHYRTEADLEDVTEDLLQACGSEADCNILIPEILARLDAKDGWYIKLDGGDRGETNPGEKVLASPSVFNGVAYYTTFTPFVDLMNPCNPAIQGSGRVYAVNYLTGEAVVNYDKGNDRDNPPTFNTRAMLGDTQVLLRSDRTQNIGEGIPSGLTPTVQPDGSILPVVGCGGGMCPVPGSNTRAIYPLYWRQK